MSYETDIQSMVKSAEMRPGSAFAQNAMKRYELQSQFKQGWDAAIQAIKAEVRKTKNQTLSIEDLNWIFE